MRVVRTLRAGYFLLSAPLAFTCAAQPTSGTLSGRPDRTQVVFGYMQNTSPTGPLASYRWHALTHIAYTFVSFDKTGSLTTGTVAAWRNRSPELKKGGAAENNGVRVIMTVSNGFTTANSNAVFTSASLRAHLIQQIVREASDPDTGCDGVTLDIEPMNVPSVTGGGYQDFMTALAAGLHALTPPRELSMYVGRNMAGRAFRDSLDYIIFSGYNFARKDTVGDVGLTSSINTGIDSWLSNGMPPEKIVLALPTFGMEYAVAKPAWGATGTKLRAIGMDEGNFDITGRQPPLEARPSGPSQSCIWTAEAATSPTGSFLVHTFDDMPAHIRKLRMAKSWTGAVQHGHQLRGIGFWSLLWLSEGTRPSSIDPHDPQQQVNPQLRRTFSPGWSAWEEEFAPPGTKYFRAATFEELNLDPHWIVTDTAGRVGNAAAKPVSVPAPAGGYAGSHRVAKISVNAEAGGKSFFQYQALRNAKPPHPLDRSSSLVLVPAGTEFVCAIYAPTALPYCSARFVIADAKMELECGPPMALSASGWQWLKWNTGAGAQRAPVADPAYRPGNGRIDTGAAGARDIALLGILMESTNQVSGKILLDQIMYSLPPDQGH